MAVEVDHTKSDMLVEFKTTLNQGAQDESWGVRDFYLHVAYCSENCKECVGPKEAECLGN